MILVKMVERRLDSAPTSVLSAGNRIYLSNKKSYVVETGYDLLTFKRIAFGKRIRTMTSSKEALLCFSEEGCLYSANLENIESRKNENVPGFGTNVANVAICNTANEFVVVGTNTGKVLMYNNAFVLRKMLYGKASGVTGIAVSALGTIACIYELCEEIITFEHKSSEKKRIKIPVGHPQAIVFIDNMHVVVGNQFGDLYLIDTMTCEIKPCTNIKDSITALFWKAPRLLIGTNGGAIILASVAGDQISVLDTKMCDGMVNALWLNEDTAIVCTGKEPRLGRWMVRKDMKNKVIVFKIEL